MTIISAFLVILLTMMQQEGFSLASRLTAAPPTYLPASALNLPLFRQAHSYTCGVASLMSCLFYWQVYDGREDTLATILGTNENGTTPDNLLKGAQTFNVSAWMKEESKIEDLREAFAEGTTIILDLQAWRGDQTDDPGECLNIIP